MTGTVDQVVPRSGSCDPGCICHGNWRLLVKETEGLLDRDYVSHDGKQFKLIGLVHAAMDYYYGMWSQEHGLRLLSCVGSIEGHGYTLLPKESDQA